MHKEKEDKKEEFEEINELLTLTPRVLDGNEKKKIEPYLSRLKQAIDQKGVRNIALTGNYGSGKSTILKTFEHLNTDHKYLPISLALFTDDIARENNEEDKWKNIVAKNSDNDVNLEEELEISILQQILYKVSAEKIPDSRFKRIRDYNSRKTYGALTFSVIWIVSAFLLFGFNFVDDLNPRNWDLNNPISWFALASIVVFLIGVLFLLKYSIRSFSNSKVNKFSIQGEIEFKEASVFNRYLDEILYFFEKTDYDVVVFEDIDRFNTVSIFTKLRDLNNLINNCDLISREITFVYAVKDTLFKDKIERVKFFDFIIPVIPFVNSRNASEQLNKLVKQYKLTKKLSNKFISDLVSFIHDIDMRLLINTFHEYNVFKDNIANDDINHEQLFSIIVYKNLYPEDFSNLYHNEGKLYGVLNKREELISALVQELKPKIPNLNKKIEEINNQKHLQVKELRSVYILQVLETIPNDEIIGIYVDNRYVPVHQLKQDDYFDSLKNTENIQYRTSRGSGFSNNISFRQIENSVDINHTYNEREELLLGRKNNLSNSIKNEIQDVRKRISRIRQLSLSEIITEINSEGVYGDFVKNDLVRFLLNEGYISENYSDFISLFHEQDLTKDEYKFRNKIKQLKEPVFNFKIENHYNFLRDLGERYFSRPQILNYDLIEYLVSKNIFIANKKIFYSSLDNRDQMYLDFIIGFINKKPDCRKEFVSNLIKNRKSIWDEIFHSKNLPDEKVIELTKYIFEYSTSDDIAELNNIESFKDYISNLEKPITFGSHLNTTASFKEFITTQSVKFKTLEISTSEKEEFFQDVVNTNCFEISFKNYNTILKSVLTDSQLIGSRNAIYSALIEFELDTIKDYADKNINEFVQKVLLYNEISNREGENSLIEILNNEDLEIQYKTDLLVIQQNKISSLKALNKKEVIELVLVSNRISPIWRNLFYYYYEVLDRSLNQIIINYLNTVRNYSTLSDSSIFDIDQEDSIKISFRDSILYCKDLNLEAYESLLAALTPLPALDASLLNTDMAEVIVRSNYIEFNSINFDQLKLIDGSVHIQLLEHNINSLITNEHGLNLSENDWYLLLESENVSEGHKKQLLHELTFESPIDHDLASRVIELHGDKKIESLGYVEIKELLSIEAPIESKIFVLMNYVDELNDEQMRNIIVGFGDNYSDLFQLHKIPTFDFSEINLSLIEELEKREIISSHEIKGSRLKVYCRRK